MKNPSNQSQRRRKEPRDTWDAPSQVDLSHLNASPLKITMPGPHQALKVYLVGCGGTGSWLAPHLVRLTRFLRETRQTPARVQVTFIDPDVVETKNVFRQNFSGGEVGGHKAELLALRYTAAWGTAIEVHATRFEKGMVQLEYGDVGVIIGCVDNAVGRRAIADALTQDSKQHGDERLPRLWWLDCGNGMDTGQVLFGAARNVRQLYYAFPYFPEPGFCVNLPAPDVQHPDLLEDRRAETGPRKTQDADSCAEMLLMGDQSPSINAMVANIAATYLWRVFADPKGLTVFATYCNLNVLSVRSRFITPDAVAQAMGKSIKMFKPHRQV